MSAKRITVIDCNIIAKNYNGYFLSNKYIHSRTKYLWKCLDLRHLPFEAEYSSVKRGHWCAECYGNKRKTINDCHRLAEEKDGYFLSNNYININTKYLWKCKNEYHKSFLMTYNDVRNKHWCPECMLYKSQNLLKDIIKNILNYEVEINYKKFYWLKNKNGYNLQIDIWVPELKLAVEYDGQQHFYPVRFGGISEKEAVIKFKNQKKLDKLKNKLIKQHPEEIKYFIRFNYKEKITKEYIIKKLIKSGIKL